MIEVMVESMREFQRAFGRAARDGEVIELPGAVGCRSPRLSGRSLVNAAIVDGADVLPELAGRYRDAEVWGVWAHESDDALRAALTELGMQIDSRPTAMGRTLNDSLSPVPGIEDLHDLDVFDAVETAAWEFPPGSLADGLPGVLDEFRCYLARDDAGAPAAIVAAVHHRGDCGVTLVATAPIARGRGLATAAMRHALWVAADDGCTTTTLQATAAGRPIYQRLGYAEFGAMELWEMRRRWAGA